MRLGSTGLWGVVCVCAAMASGCSGLGLFSKSQIVTAERLEPGGKGLFVVRPPAGDAECSVTVKTRTRREQLACNSEFLVSCDASRPDDKPFCTLMRERGPVRDSIYPADRR